MTKWVYAFGDGRADGRADMRAELGGKGANLAEMSNIGLPVPPGFTIGCSVCNAFYAHAKTYPAGLEAEVDAALKGVEAIVGAKFGDDAMPLLVSVRSGAPVSMPGMMDTILNLGLTDAAVEGLAKSSGDARFAYDSYRRFIQMYADVVLGVDHGVFEDLLETAKLDRGASLDTELTADDLKALTVAYKKAVHAETGDPFPQDPKAQLWGAIGAVLKSWMNPRADYYRRMHDISADMGTAVTVQAMVFGNMGDDCATGVAFTRDPSTGENSFYGEYLINAQGEDVVAGIRTPQSISKAAREKAGSDKPSMEESMPAVYAELASVRDLLERHYTDMQDIEFTVQSGKLYMLQTRSGKRTAAAAVRIAVEMANEGLVDRNTALTMVDARALDQLLHPTIDPSATKDVIAKGLPASPGAAVGEVCFTADAAEDLAKQGRKVILVRIETSPED
ncbi:MAG: PEP/pyruvate-binding domain-containing protein, partial [Pseudomonadota bacterium]